MIATHIKKQTHVNLVINDANFNKNVKMESNANFIIHNLQANKQKFNKKKNPSIHNLLNVIMVSNAIKNNVHSIMISIPLINRNKNLSTRINPIIKKIFSANMEINAINFHLDYVNLNIPLYNKMEIKTKMLYNKKST
jgi:hypothetical protein